MRDAGYAAVGFAVIAAQRALVRRREVQAAVEPQLKEAAARLERLAEVVEEQVNPVLDRFEERLPDNTRELVRQAREAATHAANQARRRLVDVAGAPKRPPG